MSIVVTRMAEICIKTDTHGCVSQTTTAMINRIFDGEYHQRKRAEDEEWMRDRFGYVDKFAPADSAPLIIHILFLIFVFFPLATLDLFLYGDK